MLTELNIQHLQVLYDKLYFPDDVEEWKRVFSFLNDVGLVRHDGDNNEELTKEKFQGAMSYIPMSSQDQRTNLKNYDTIRLY
jgi:hypothetical protein